MTKAIFFDRDGVVNYRLVKDYVKSADEFHFVPDFFDFFRNIKNAGYLAVLVTNQQSVGKGIMTEAELCEIFDHMQREIRKSTGFAFDDIYYCTALSQAGSPDRKPNPGMLLKAIEKWDIDRVKSWMIGDRGSDAQAGRNAGVHSIIVGNSPDDEKSLADICFANFNEAWKWFELEIKGCRPI